MADLAQQYRQDVYRFNPYESNSDEILRIKFQYSALQKRLSNENELRSEISDLRRQLSELSRQLSCMKSERDRFAETLKATASLSKDFIGV
jgi:predicted RNase H-like nuclease (RuvC/YqgF family)